MVVVFVGVFYPGLRSAGFIFVICCVPATNVKRNVLNGILEVIDWVTTKL